MRIVARAATAVMCCCCARGQIANKRVLHSMNE